MFKLTKKVTIKIKNLDVYIDGKITMSDNYCGVVVADEFLPITKMVKLAGITDHFPYERPNDTVMISDANITINGVTKKGVTWFDIYIGNGFTI